MAKKNLLSKSYYLILTVLIVSWSLAIAWPAFGAETIIFGSSRDGRNQIFSMNNDGSNQKNLSNSRGPDDNPVLSPDGTKIVFISKRDGNGEIYVMNVDGTGQKRLTVNAADDADPSWSPDGTRIVFISNRGAKKHSIFIMNADGTIVRKIVSGPDMHSPAWSPDGRKIAFSSAADGNIYVINLATLVITNLTKNPSHNDFPAWSPQGDQIVFASDRFSRNARQMFIFTMNANGSNQQTILPFTTQFNTFDFRHPFWSPDGAQIVFALNAIPDNNNARNIWIMDRNGFNRKPLTQNSAEDNRPRMRVPSRFLIFR